jgi:hypothetical protein
MTILTVYRIGKVISVVTTLNWTNPEPFEVNFSVNS